MVISRRRLITTIGAASIGMATHLRLPMTTSNAQAEIQVLKPGRYFAQTGHNLRSPFLERWQNANGETSLGVPLSEERFEPAIGVVQTFEGMTLVYDPGMEAPWDLQGQMLTKDYVDELAPAVARKKISQCAADAFFCQYFPETGHSISGGIASFWSLYGDLPLFGMPLSEPFRQSGGGFTTQVFEKAALEDHGQDDVRLRFAGLEISERAGLLADLAFLPAPPTAGDTMLVSAEDGLRLRSGPDLAAEIVVVLPDNAEFIIERGASGDWMPGYADGYAGWVASEFLKQAPPLPKISTADWNPAIWQGAALSETNVRDQPATTAGVVSVLPYGGAVEVARWVKGEEVFQGASLWAEIGGGGYIYARNIGRTGPVVAPPLPADAPGAGQWIDANLTQQLLVAYQDREPVHVAVMTSGMAGWETPPGLYSILVRVANETMESGAIGAEHFYKLEDVLFTQYFTDVGHAIHYAWWRTAETIGRPGSHGCLNLLLDDSRFFWEWAGIGAPVLVHY